jgi:hypothetical protein
MPPGRYGARHIDWWSVSSVVKWLALLVSWKLEFWWGAYHDAYQNAKSILATWHKTRQDSKSSNCKTHWWMLAVVTSEKRRGLPAVGLPLCSERETKLWCSVNSLSVKVRVWLRPVQRGRSLLDKFRPPFLVVRSFFLTHPSSLR